MLSYFKINSEQSLEWVDDPEDLQTFIVIIAVTEREFGNSTYLLSNTNKVKTVASKFKILGISNVRIISQFDIKTEAGFASLERGMSVIGLNALRLFLDAKRRQPFMYADLKRFSDTAEVTRMAKIEDEEETESLDYPSFN
jgi:hypothetical protein